MTTEAGTTHLPNIKATKVHVTDTGAGNLEPPGDTLDYIWSPTRRYSIWLGRRKNKRQGGCL